MKRSHELAILIAILLVGALIRGLYLAEMVHAPEFAYPGVDPAYHDYWARGLATGDWSGYAPFQNPHIEKTPYFRPPGYPYFLGLIYYLTNINLVAVRVVQMAIGLLSAFLAYKLGRRWLGSAAGLIAAALMSVYWVFIYYEGELLEPVLLIPLGLGLVYELSLLAEKVTWPRALIAGALMGLFALCRPNIGLFGAVVIIWIWWIAKDRRLALNASIALALGAIVTISPATIRNYVVAHDFVPISCNLGINLFIGNNESANGLCAMEIGDLGGSGTCFDYPALVANMERKVGRPLKYSEASGYLSQQAVQYIKSHPGETLRLMVRKAEFFWSPVEVGHNEEDVMERLHSGVLRRVPGSFPFVFGFGVIGAGMLFVDSWRKKDAQKQYAVLILMGLFVLLYWVSFLPFFSAGQYRIPIVPFLMLFTAYGVSRIGQLAISRSFVPAACWLLAGIAAFGLASINLTGYQPDASKWHYDQGVTYERIGKPDDAINEYREAIRVKPRLFQAHGNLGLLLVDKGKTDEALYHFRQALAVYPRDEWSYYGIGLVYERQGKLTDAVKQFQKAINLLPDHFMAYHELGLIAAAQGNLSEAVSHFQAALRIEPQFNLSRLLLAAILESQGKLDEAAEHYRKALEVSPEADTHLRLAGVLIRQKKLDEALECYRHVVRLSPNDPVLRFNLGVALEQQDKRDEAIRQYKEAVRLQPGYMKAHKNLAVALYFTADYAGAWEEVKLCRKYGGTPHPEFVKALAERMEEPR